ncbi:MAG: hypothetical protein AAB681_01645 [Patescibacteria group bacterium]
MENEQRKYWFFGSKLNSVLLIVLIVLMVFALKEMRKNQDYYKENLGLKDSYQPSAGDTKYEKDNENSYSTYTYTNHGFSIELPKGYVPHEEQSEGGPSSNITLPKGNLVYITNLSFWKKYNMGDYIDLGSQKIGITTFKLYKDGGVTIYWFEQGNIAYLYTGDPAQLETFKFVGWAQE